MVATHRHPGSGEKELGASQLALIVGEDLRSIDTNARLHQRLLVGRGYE